MISNQLIEGLTAIGNAIWTGQLTHPARFALLLEDLATDAWNEARKLNEITWTEAEDLQPSFRIDP